MNQQSENFDRAKQLLIQENKAIAAARNMATWQIQTSYFLAMLNNQAMKNGREEIALVLIPGDPPTLKQNDT